MHRWFHINYHSGVPIYVQLKEQIKTAMAGGVLASGDQLPSVRDLAVALVVNPNTVARAYSELEREGLLSVEQGRGTFIKGGEPLLREEERITRIAGRIDRLLVEAYHLQVPEHKIRQIWEQRFTAWQERLRDKTKKGDD